MAIRYREQTVLWRLTCTRTNKKHIENNRITDCKFSLRKVSSIKNKTSFIPENVPSIIGFGSCSYRVFFPIDFCLSFDCSPGVSWLTCYAKLELHYT